jgi:hypothetical protein
MLLGLPHLGMVGWGVFIAQHKTSRWRKDAALYGTPNSPVPLSGVPSHWTDMAGDRWRAGFLHRTLWTSHQTVQWSFLHSAT